jgi:hypothetical protein
MSVIVFIASPAAPISAVAYRMRLEALAETPTTALPCAKPRLTSAETFSCAARSAGRWQL